MKLCVRTLIVALLVGLVVADAATAQRQRREKRQKARAGETESQAASPGAPEDADLIQSLEMFVYPADGQGAEQQKADEAECAAWAQEEIAGMPEVAPQLEGDAAEDQESRREERRAGDRSGLKGAARGAVVGAALEDDEPELPKSRDDIGDNVKDRDDISPPESRDDVGDNVKRARDDDGPSATEVGAAVGAVAGRRREKKAEAKAETEAAEAELKTAEQAEGDSLRKALKVCLEAKGYNVE